MDLHQQLKRAIFIAIDAHGKQLDKYGQPYICHPFRVMDAGVTLEEKIVGILHDVIEDTHLLLTDLLKEGFSEEIIDALHAISRLENESYNHYISRLTKSDLARRVKLNDLKDNLSMIRASSISNNDIDRMRRYIDAHNKLIQQ